MRLLLLAFVLVPVIEIYLLIRVGQWLGAWPTIGIILATALAGAWLLRQQGLATLARGRLKLQEGVLPTREMVEGLLLATGGALLLTPGFMTDLVGLLCLLPWSRRWLARSVLAGGLGGTAWRSAAAARPFDRHSSRADPDPRGGHTIEGEYTREKDDRRP